MHKPQVARSSIPTSQTSKWKTRIAGPNTIQKVMRGGVANPTLSLLINAPPAIQLLNFDKSASSHKILRIAFAWSTFLESASKEEQELAQPAFRRFIDSVSICISSTSNMVVAQQLFGSFTLPVLLEYGSRYLMNKLFTLFSICPAGQKRIFALAHLEDGYAMLIENPEYPQYPIIRGMLKFYESSPSRLNVLSSRECAGSLCGFLFSQSSRLLHSNQMDLLAYALAWAPNSMFKEKTTFMNGMADNYPKSIQIALFSRLIELIPLMPTPRNSIIREPLSTRTNSVFPELSSALKMDNTASQMVEAAERKRLIAAAWNHLRGTGLVFVSNSPRILAFH